MLQLTRRRAELAENQRAAAHLATFRLKTGKGADGSRQYQTFPVLFRFKPSSTQVIRAREAGADERHRQRLISLTL